MIITRDDVRDTAKCEALVDAALDNMGIEEMEAGAEIRDAARRYYIELIQQHLDNADDEDFTGYFGDSEGMVWGFVAGYEACLKARKLALQ